MRAQWWGMAVVCLFLISSVHVQADTWRSVTDDDGITWARVLIVNESQSDSTWSIMNCRTAIASDVEFAEVDIGADWNGLVTAGSSQYVWIYGREIGDIEIVNADGGVSEFMGTISLVDNSNGELVIVVNADGTSSVLIEAGADYGVPGVAGGLPQ